MSQSPTASLGRVEAIDIFRGLALAAMLLVNNPGSWGSVYWPLLHADWHGLTPTDLVFPFFLFAVGASMACSFRQRVIQQQIQWGSILKRTVLLFAIGLLLHAFPFDKALENIRILGVLQRIAVSFFIVALIVAWLPERFLAPFGIAVLLIYWWLLEQASTTPYALETNLVRTWDLVVLGASHMWQGKGIAFDPEGLLSTVPSAISVLSGYWISVRVFQLPSHTQQRNQLVIIGTGLSVLGLAWAYFHPINKSLWTGSFVLVTSACACFTLAVITQFWHIWQSRLFWNAMKIYGSNALTLYVAAWLFAAMLRDIDLTISGNTFAIKTGIYYALTYALPDKLASLVYALGFTVIFYALAKWLYDRKIFIRL